MFTNLLNCTQWLIERYVVRGKEFSDEEWELIKEAEWRLVKLVRELKEKDG